MTAASRRNQSLQVAIPPEVYAELENWTLPHLDPCAVSPDLLAEHERLLSRERAQKAEHV